MTVSTLTSASATTTSATTTKFRARKLDHHKSLKIFDLEELQALGDDGEIIISGGGNVGGITNVGDLIQRTAPLVATGVDKEEEEEEHLQAALSSALMAPKSQAYVIPTPRVQEILSSEWESLYPIVPPPSTTKRAKPLVGTMISATLSSSSLINDYALDDRDEQFCYEHQVDTLLLENLFGFWEEVASRLSVNSVSADNAIERFPQVPLSTLEMVHQYWREKRMPILKVEDVDSSKIGSDPYVCFRRREMKLPRKTRRSDAQCLDKLRKMRYELETLSTGLSICAIRDTLKLQSWDKEHQLFLAYSKLTPTELTKIPSFKVAMSRKYQPEPSTITGTTATRGARRTPSTAKLTGKFPSNVDIVMEVEALMDKMRLPPHPNLDNFVKTSPRIISGFGHSRIIDVRRDQSGRMVIDRFREGGGDKQFENQYPLIAKGNLLLKECALLNSGSVGNYNHHYVQAASGLTMPLTLSSWIHISQEYQLTPDVHRRTGSATKKLKSSSNPPQTSGSLGTTSNVSTNNSNANKLLPTTSNSNNINITVKVKSRSDNVNINSSSSPGKATNNGPGSNEGNGQTSPPTPSHHHASFFTPTGLSSSLSSSSVTASSSMQTRSSNRHQHSHRTRDIDLPHGHNNKT